MEKIDLKLGTIREPLPDFILKKLAHAFDNANNYPMDYERLAGKLARFHGIGKDRILLLNGTDGSIDLITKVLARKVYYYEPTYYEFWAAPKRNNIKYQALKPLRNDEYSLETRAFEKGSVLFLCNPNNPFGEIPVEQILEFASKSEGYVAVDEAYIAFSGKSPLEALEKHSNLLLMRSFSKTYALAGIRAGYTIAAPELLKKLGEHKLFFDVSSPSVEAALAVLDHHDYFKERIAKLVACKRRFDDFLRERGFNVIPSHINNTIIHFKSEEEAGRFVRYLDGNGVIVNQGDGISTVGLDKTWLRFACGTEEQMQKVTGIVSRYNHG